METISLAPRFEILNRYFHYYKTKEEYAKDLEMADRVEPILSSYYNSYKQREESLRLEKAKKVVAEIDVTEISQLCDDNDLSGFTDDILFASLNFISQIPYYKKLSSSIDSIRGATLENYKTLKGVLLNKERLSEIQIIIGKPKQRKNALIIWDREIVSDVLGCIEGHVLNNLSNFLFTEERLTEKDFNIEFIESEISEIQKLRRGRKPGLNTKQAGFIINLHAYLENETSLRAEPGTTISSDQCDFMFDILCILKITDYYEKFRGLYKSEYIWTLINNERIKREKSKTRTK